MSHKQFSDFITYVVEEVLLAKTRAAMDSENFHVIQFSKESIKLGYSKGFRSDHNAKNKMEYLPSEDEIDRVYRIVLDIIQKNTKPFDWDNPLKKGFTGIYRVSTLGNKYDAATASTDEGMLLIGNSFQALRTFLSNKISRNPELKKTFIGVRTIELKSIDKKTGIEKTVINQKEVLPKHSRHLWLLQTHAAKFPETPRPASHQWHN